MTMDLMIPSKADVPSYVLNAELARHANEEAAAGISTGYPARVRAAQGKFTLINSAGEETPFPASKLFNGPDENQYFPVIVLRAKRQLSKSWYATAFNPNASEFVSPDCFSNDAERPDQTSKSPQSDLCATCALNAFGSGKDQAGNATKGKACSDTKILAVFVPHFGIHSFKVQAGSLKNWGSYVKDLSAAGIPLSNVKTLIGFDPTVTTSVMIFRFGGYVQEAFLPKIAEMSASLEAEEIVVPVMIQSAKQIAPAVAPKQVEAKSQEADDLGLNEVSAAETAKKTAAAKAKAEAAAAKKAAAAKAKTEAEAKAAAAALVQAPEVIDPGGSLDGISDDDLGLGLDL